MKILKTILLTTVIIQIYGYDHFQFEVYGKVQGVYFRKYTQLKAKELNLTGWVQNTSQGTVIGVIEGSPSRLKEMKHWLSKVGSPKSKITKLIIKDEQCLEEAEFNEFNIIK